VRLEKISPWKQTSSHTWHKFAPEQHVCDANKTLPSIKRFKNLAIKLTHVKCKNHTWHIFLRRHIKIKSISLNYKI